MTRHGYEYRLIFDFIGEKGWIDLLGDWLVVDKDVLCVCVCGCAMH